MKRLPFSPRLPFRAAATPAAPSVSSPGVITPMRRPRMFLVLGILALWLFVICCRLVWLQVFRHHDFVEQAARQQEHGYEVAPRRGVLYDRNLHELAMTVLVDSIFAVPSEIGAARPETAAALAKIVHTDPTDRYTTEKQILARLNASRAFAWIARKQDPAIIAKVKALNLKGIYFQKEFKRFYPDNKIAAQVLGYVGIDDNGLGGLEENFNDDLHGTPGHMMLSIDARRHALSSEEREPLPGENLVLSIDANIQFMAEQALDRNMERTHAQNGTIVVQDPHTGQILALAVRPTFNPNDFRHATTDLLKDRAVSDVYEPGSTFKPVTYSAALEEKAITPDTPVDCGGGQINIAGHTVHDAPGDHFGVIPAWKALAVSSNVCAIRVGQRLGPERLYKYIRAFGFGERSGIELPAETRGLLEPLRHWSTATMGAVPMGQEVAVTPIQIATMVSTIANGGMYLPPHILLESTDLTKANAELKPMAFHPENSLPGHLPDGAHRVISELTAAQMRKMMEDVVTIGTAHLAVHLNGYSAAGKTGTAQKIDPRTHTYSKVNFVASFVGFAPVNNPAITMVVVMDSPQHSMHYGAEASAPVFQDLAQQILEYLGVPHDEPMRSTQEMAAIQASSKEDDEPAQQVDNLNALFDEVNNLPADDPLRSQPAEHNPVPVAKDAALNERAQATPDSGVAADAVPPQPEPQPEAPAGPTKALPASPEEKASQPANSSVVVASGKRVTVPSFSGQTVRKVIEEAGAAGLAVEVRGSGIARDQAPAAGTSVPEGTRVVVRFER